MRKLLIPILIIVAVVVIFLILRKPKPKPIPTTAPTTVTRPVAPKKADWYDVYFSQVYEGDKEIAAANPNSVDRKLVEKLALAKKSIDAALHEIDSETITGALIDAHKRRVKLRIVTETDYMDEHSIEALQKAKVPVVNDSGRSGLMHNKFIIVGLRRVLREIERPRDDRDSIDNNYFVMERPFIRILHHRNAHRLHGWILRI